MFLHRCSYENSCLVSWHNSSSVLVLIFASELPQKHWHHIHNNRNWLKQPQSHFHWAIPHKSHHFFAVIWWLIPSANHKKNWFCFVNVVVNRHLMLIFSARINIQKQPLRGVLRKKVFWKYAANLQENTHAEVRFQ